MKGLEEMKSFKSLRQQKCVLSVESRIRHRKLKGASKPRNVCSLTEQNKDTKPDLMTNFLP